MSLSRGDVLLIVGVQNDFLPGGALPVARGAEIVAPLDRCIEAFARRALPIYVIRYWHPTDHRAFRPQGGPWPPHCIAGLHGAGVPAQLHPPPEGHLVLAGTRPEDPPHSGFYATGLAVKLRGTGCRRRRVLIGGLAIEYAIRATALDALAAGFDAILLEDAIRALEVHPGDGARALDDLRSHGVRLMPIDSVLSATIAA